MKVSWESLHLHVQRKDLCGYEVCQTVLKIIDEGVMISSGKYHAKNNLSVWVLR